VTPANISISQLPGLVDRLGESPVWDPRDGCLYWVDSKGQAVKRYNSDTEEISVWHVPGDIGSIALTRPGSLLLAMGDSFHRLDLASGAVEHIAAVGLPKEDMRLNDGRTDRQGRFLSGSMVVGRADRDGGLYRLGLDGKVEQLDKGIAISNSICFSPTGDRLYYADSLQSKIFTYEYDPETGAVGPRNVFLETATLGSVPDGATVDSEGHLWVALVQCGQVVRISPDAEVVQTVDFPVTYVSCPAFGGRDLDVLYVTSISNSGHRLVSDHPQAGRVFVVSGLGVKGLEEARYGE